MLTNGPSRAAAPGSVPQNDPGQQNLEQNLRWNCKSRDPHPSVLTVRTDRVGSVCSEFCCKHQQLDTGPLRQNQPHMFFIVIIIFLLSQNQSLRTIGSQNQSLRTIGSQNQTLRTSRTSRTSRTLRNGSHKVSQRQQNSVHRTQPLVLFTFDGPAGIRTTAAS